MVAPSLLPGERVLREFRPHPASFLGAYAVAALPAVWAVCVAAFVRSPLWAKVPWNVLDWSFLPVAPEAAAAFAVTLGGLAALGSWVATARIQWSAFFAYLAIGAVAVLASWPTGAATTVPLLLAAGSLLLLLLAEAGRRRHQYRLTDVRIIVRGGLLASKERQVRYESITDLDCTQGPLGRWMGFGTIVPVTQSGFGLGSDSSQAGIAAGVAGRRGGLGVMAGGGRQVQSGRARTFHQLTGAHPFDEVKRLLEEQVHSGSQATLLQAQVDLQRQMLAAMHTATTTSPGLDIRVAAAPDDAAPSQADVVRRPQT